jgi:L-lactate dehydrogenase
MQPTVGILGTGWVGSSVAISTLHAGFAGELLLADARNALARSADVLRGAIASLR